MTPMGDIARDHISDLLADVNIMFRCMEEAGRRYDLAPPRWRACRLRDYQQAQRDYRECLDDLVRASMCALQNTKP